MSGFRRLAREGAWVAGGQIASALGVLVGIRLLTEILSPAVFGNVSLLLGIAALASGLCTAPLMQAILRFYSASADVGHANKLRKIALRTLMFVCLTMGCLIAVGWLVWRAFFGGWVWMGILLAAMLFVDGRRSLEVTFLNAARQQKIMSIWTALEAWLRPGAAAALVLYLGQSAEVVLAGYMCASAALILLFRSVLSRQIDVPHSLVSGTSLRDGTLAREMLRYALPLTPLALVGWISAQADRYFLGGMLDLQAVGTYSAIYGLVSRPFLLAGASVELTIRPMYYDAIASGEILRVRSIERHSLQMLILVCTTGSVAFLILHSQLADVFLADEYREYSMIMPCIALGYSFLVIAQFYERICYAHDNTSAGVVIQSAGAAASIGVTIPLVWSFGINGASVAVPVYFFVQMLFARYFANKARVRHKAIKFKPENQR